MKLEELRLGNLTEQGYISSIQYQDGYMGCFVTKTNIDSSGGNWIAVDKLEPIPLTEEWLLKLGLLKNTKRVKSGAEVIDWSLINSLYSVKTLKCDDNNFWFCVDSRPLKMLAYVHELQNIYYQLGEELTIKE